MRDVYTEWWEKHEVGAQPSTRSYRHDMARLALPEPSEELIEDTKLLGFEFFPEADVDVSGTTLTGKAALTKGQLSAHKAAKTLVKNAEREYTRIGELENFRNFARLEEADAELLQDVDALAEANSVLEGGLDEAFDFLDIGLSTVTGTVDEYYRTGSAWEAIKQGAIELGHAMPGIQVEGARTLSWADVEPVQETLDRVFSNEAGGRVGRAITAFALDVIFDPINLVPGGIFLKGAKVAGRGLKGTHNIASELIGIDGLKPVGEFLANKFVADRELYSHGEKLGASVVTAKNEYNRAIDELKINTLHLSQKIFGDLSPRERRFLTLWFDPANEVQSAGRFDEALDEMITRSVISQTGGRREAIKESYGKMKEQFNYLAKKGVDDGLFDSAKMKSDYMWGSEPLIRHTVRSLDRVASDENIAFDFLKTKKDTKAEFHNISKSLNSMIMPNYAKKRVTNNNVDRILKGYATEVDAAAVLFKRTFDQERWHLSKKFNETILNDPNVAIKLRVGNTAESLIKILPVPKNILDEDLVTRKKVQELAFYKRELLEKKKDEVLRNKAEATEGMVIRGVQSNIPRGYTSHRRQKRALTSEAIQKLMKSADYKKLHKQIEVLNAKLRKNKKDHYSKPEWEDANKWASVKRGLEEANPGYKVLELPIRNIGDVSKPIEGAYLVPFEVERAIVNTDKLLKDPSELEAFWAGLRKFTDMWKGYVTATPGFHMRNMMGMMFLNWTAGVGTDWKQFAKGNISGIKDNFALKHLQGFKLAWMNSGATGIPESAKKYMGALGFSKIEDVPMPKGFTAEEVLKLGTDNDVAQIATKLSVGTPEDLTKTLLTGGLSLSGKAAWEKSLAKGVRASDESLVGREAQALIETEGATAGGEVKSFLERLGNSNRALGQTVDNVGRWTLFLDRLEKGETAAAAALATKRYHYDYRRLSDFEKKIMQTVIPFYAWMRFNIPNMFRSMAENPARFSKVPKLQNAIEEMNAEGTTDRYEPDYFDELITIQVPIVRNDRQLYLQPDLPLTDAGRLDARSTLSSLNPLIVGLYEAVSAQKLFTGGPIERRGAHSGEDILGLEPRISNIAKNIPPYEWLSRGTKKWKDDEFVEFLSSFVGGMRVAASDYPRWARGRDHATAAHVRKFNLKLEKERRRLLED